MQNFQIVMLSQGISTKEIEPVDIALKTLPATVRKLEVATLLATGVASLHADILILLGRGSEEDFRKLLVLTSRTRLSVIYLWTHTSPSIFSGHTLYLNPKSILSVLPARINEIMSEKEKRVRRF
jgi:hypothetical protein